MGHIGDQQSTTGCGSHDGQADEQHGGNAQYHRHTHHPTRHVRQTTRATRKTRIPGTVWEEKKFSWIIFFHWIIYIFWNKNNRMKEKTLFSGENFFCRTIFRPPGQYFSPNTFLGEYIYTEDIFQPENIFQLTIMPIAIVMISVMTTGWWRGIECVHWLAGWVIWKVTDWLN